MIEAPLTLGGAHRLHNRLVKSAMSETLGDEHNDPTRGLIQLYRRWGASGAALLITGNFPVDRYHLEHPANIVIDMRSDREKLRALSQAAKAEGAVVLAQLSHSGRQTPESVNPTPLSLSDRKLYLAGYGQPRPASEADLDAVTDQFIRSAVVAQETGFDGVEVHAAHGYLMSSALSPRINTRHDRWGGSLENRARLLRNVIRGIRNATRDQFVIAVKLNSADFQKGGFSHEESIEIARMLDREPVDLLEISGGNFEAPIAYDKGPLASSTEIREAYFLDYARDIKAAISLPVMVTGGFRTRAIMERALGEAATDLIGMARPFIIDPDFPKRLLAGSMQAAPAPERSFPPSAALPRGAALNWFSHQLWKRGTSGQADPMATLMEGHERHLAWTVEAGERLARTRSA